MATRKSSCNCGQLGSTYDGPDPERITLCQCNECPRRTGSVYSVQARLPIEHVTIQGKSTTWKFPGEREATGHVSLLRQRGPDVSLLPRLRFDRLLGDLQRTGRHGCRSRRFHRPDVSAASGFRFAAYGAVWALNVTELPKPLGQHDYEGTSHGGPRA